MVELAAVIIGFFSFSIFAAHAIDAYHAPPRTSRSKPC